MRILTEQVEIGREALELITNIDHGPEELWNRWLFKRDGIVDRAREVGLLEEKK